MNYIRSLTILLLAAVAISCAALAAADDPAEIMKTPAVHAALEAAKTNEPATIETQIHLCEIPAPPFKESKRAEELAKLFREAGLQNVRIDAAGNVLGDRPGRSPHPHLVMAAHLDTVFPEGTDVHVKRDGTILKGSRHRRRLPRPRCAAGRDSRAARNKSGNQWHDHICWRRGRRRPRRSARNERAFR